MTFFFATFPTPAGPLSVAVNAEGAIVATAFGPLERLRGRAPGALEFIEDPTRLRAASTQIADYFAGRQQGFTVPLAPIGSAFQRTVWAELARIPFGETRSYGDIARTLGTAPRAVGRANATNPIALLIPCHRVIGANGTLTGYAFGETIKRRLLEHEGVPISSAGRPVPTKKADSNESARIESGENPGRLYSRRELSR
jgi:methylated-DNA-[protein]-cysteine S-methyltransferase